MRTATELMYYSLLRWFSSIVQIFIQDKRNKPAGARI